VSTTLGAFGIDAGAGQGVDLADTPEAFAAACLALLKDPRAALARAGEGRAFVSREYDWKRIEQDVAALAREAAANP
jgi:glycosyltransferase involved in cell wall biosynthesis